MGGCACSGVQKGHPRTVASSFTVPTITIVNGGITLLPLIIPNNLTLCHLNPLFPRGVRWLSSQKNDTILPVKDGISRDTLSERYSEYKRLKTKKKKSLKIDSCLKMEIPLSQNGMTFGGNKENSDSQPN